MTTQSEYYKKLKPIAEDLEKSERVVCGALRTSPSKREARRQFVQYRNDNAGRLRKDMLRKAQAVEGVGGPIAAGLLTWALGWMLTPLIDAGKRALWAAVKQHVKELLDKLQRELFEEDE